MSTLNYQIIKANSKYELLQLIDEITDTKNLEITVHDIEIYKDFFDATIAMESFIKETGCHSHAVKFWDITSEAAKNGINLKKERDEFVSLHSIHKSNDFVFCSSCLSTLNPRYIKGEKCPLCGADLRSRAVLDELNKYDQKLKDNAENNKEIYWYVCLYKI